MIKKFKQLFGIDYQMTEQEALIYDIIENLCYATDSEIKMAPLTRRYFIVNKRLEYWVRVYEDAITITNHKFTFAFRGDTYFHPKLIKMIENIIEWQRDQFEQTVFQNEMNLLEEIRTNVVKNETDRSDSN